MAKSKPMPETAYLRECFSYDPETGTMTWRARPRHHFTSDKGWHICNGREVGKAAGSIVRTHCKIYVRVEIGGRSYAAHRLIYKLIMGREPENDIDHHDGDGTNNRWRNLRPATARQNACNAPARPGKYPRGVIRSKRGVVFYARITVNGERRTIGSYPTPEAAHEAYLAMAKYFHAGFAHANRPDHRPTAFRSG